MVRVIFNQIEWSRVSFPLKFSCYRTFQQVGFSAKKGINLSLSPFFSRPQSAELNSAEDRRGETPLMLAIIFPLHPSTIPLSNVSFYVPILGSKKGTCLSDRPALLHGFQKGKLTYSFERISCSGHLKSESAVVRVHWCDPGLREWSVGWSPLNHPGWL